MSTTSVASQDSAPRIIRLPAVLQVTGLSRSTLYELDKAGKFPTKVQLSTRAVGWVQDEVDSWIASRVAARDGGGA